MEGRQPAQDAPSARASGLLGTYTSGRASWRSFVLAGVVMVAGVILETLVFGEDRRQVIAQSSFYLVLIVALTVLGRGRRPHTTITRDGLEVLTSITSRTRAATWLEVREVRPPAPLSRSGDVLLATGEEVPLVGMKRAEVEQLAELLSALQQLSPSGRST